MGEEKSMYDGELRLIAYESNTAKQDFNHNLNYILHYNKNKFDCIAYILISINALNLINITKSLTNISRQEYDKYMKSIFTNIKKYVILYFYIKYIYAYYLFI